MPIDPTRSASEYTTYIREKADIVQNGSLNFAGALFKSAVFASSAGKQEFPTPVSYRILTGFSSMKFLYYPGLNLGTSDFTVECFFKATGNSGYLWTFDGQHTWMRIDRTQLQLTIDDGSIRTISDFIPDTWYHVALTRFGNNWYSMINGFNSFVVTDAFSLSSAGVFIGARAGYEDDNRSPFEGSISNFRCVKRALYNEVRIYDIPSAPLEVIANTELLLLAQPGAAFADSSPANRVAQGSCNIMLGPISPFPELFDEYGILTGFSSTRNLRYNINPAEFNFTVECFFRPTAANARIWYFNTSTAFTGASILSGVFNMDVNGLDTVPLGAVSENTWYHCALTRNGTDWYGSFNGTTKYLGNISINLQLTSLRIGYVSEFLQGFGGAISNFRYAKTPLYTTGTYTTTPPLTLAYSVRSILPLTVIVNTELLLLAKPGAPLIDSSNTPKVAIGLCDGLPGPISV